MGEPGPSKPLQGEGAGVGDTGLREGLGTLRKGRMPVENVLALFESAHELGKYPLRIG